MDFMDRVLALQGNSPIKKVFLKCVTEVDSNRVNQWISRVLQRGVRYMDLFLDFGYRSYRQPPPELMSKTLVELKIRTGFTFKFFSGHISLTELRTLSLDRVWLSSGQLQLILSACPVLEELDMKNIDFSYGDEIVSSASFKALTIQSACFLHALSLDTPNLVCLKSESLAWDYPTVNLEKLVEAQIKLTLTADQVEKLTGLDDGWLEDNVLLKLGKVQKLVRGICNVQKLYLSPGALQVLALCCQAMPVFKNLTFLDIESSMDIAWQAMPVLLRNCPHLETLVWKGGLLHRVTDKCGDACICISREEKGLSLVSCPVKRLEIRDFDGLMRDLEMVKHFLECFPCLEEMEIYTREGRQRFLDPLVPELNSGMLMRYNNLLGRSPNVNIKVHGTFSWERTGQ